MRVGYDRVPSDTRSPLVPDLPFDELAKRGRRELQEDAGRGFIAITAIFGLMLLVAIGLGLYSSNTARISPVELGSAEAPR